MQVTLTFKLDVNPDLDEAVVTQALTEALAGFRKVPLAVVVEDDTEHEVFVEDAKQATATEHIQGLATRYAEALVAYHTSCSNANYDAMCDLQEELNGACKQMANDAYWTKRNAEAAK